jgi:uncharacterized membrane protein YhaH (DUF805 family)
MGAQNMGFTEAVSTCFGKYADFNGRASRAEYWYWYLFRMLMVGGMIFLAVASRVNLVFVLVGLELLVMLLPSLAVAVRRLHDVNMSGWLLLLVFVPFGGLFIFILSVIPGTAGGNKYGPGPYGQGLAEVF